MYRFSTHAHIQTVNDINVWPLCGSHAPMDRVPLIRNIRYYDAEVRQVQDETGADTQIQQQGSIIINKIYGLKR